MPSPATPRVFISYATKDTNIVGRVRGALAEAGVAVWLDHEQLTPGTPDWRAAVLRGIEQATTVIYAASPDAASSKYVAHELAIAEGEGKTILPFWIRGQKWYFCAPMGFYVAQHIDGRDAAFASGLAKLLAALGAASAATTSSAPASQSHASEPQPERARASLLDHHSPPATLPQPRYPLTNVPAQLASRPSLPVSQTPQGRPMPMLKLTVRTIFGLLASAIMLIIDILYSLTNTLVKVAGGSGLNSHFFIGIVIVIIGAVGAFLADPLPTASVVLMLIAGIAFFFLIGFWAVIPAIVFLLAILLVFFDRNHAKA